MTGPLIPGEIRPASGTHVLNAGRESQVIVVTNDGDRPIQIGSHFHFADVNTSLTFDRAGAVGFRLDVAAGTAVRFEPGASREVTLVRFRGDGVVPGLQLRPFPDSAGAPSTHRPDDRTAEG